MTQIQDYRPPSQDRVREHSSAAVNQRIDRAARGAIVELVSPDAIRARLAELDREWHLDRALMGVFSVLGTLTARAGMRSIARRGRLGLWGLLFFTQMGFLAHHAVRGWCPPVAVLRRLGIRTSQEIGAERAALERKLARLGL
ncbi:MAG TPA: hypothetical protein VK932_07985 [Kofleriaceae bacterium]|nr:hypothetical protein [Kofleriaceae bacterium]